jgi:hypothetical protein
VRPYLEKIHNKKRAGRMAQAVGGSCPANHEALSSNPSPTKKTKTKTKHKIRLAE